MERKRMERFIDQQLKDREAFKELMRMLIKKSIDRMDSGLCKVLAFGGPELAGNVQATSTSIKHLSVGLGSQNIRFAVVEPSQRFGSVC